MSRGSVRVFFKLLQTCKPVEQSWVNSRRVTCVPCTVFSTLRQYEVVKPCYDVSLRKIHITASKNALPPIVLIVLRPILKIGAMLFGRSIRKWWGRLSEDEKDKVRWKIKSRQKQIAFFCSGLLGFGFIYYLEQVQEEPITKRKRFIIYNDEQMKMIAELEYERQIEEFKTDLVPGGHPFYRRIQRVANRILRANNNLEGVKNKEWAVVVVDRPDITNAFVLPHGKIFVFTGILNVCTNDDELAIVLSHEISHALLSHVAESLSKTFLLEMIFLVPLVVIWAVFSDVGALFSQWLSTQLADLTIHLPFSRAIETEADAVGLYLAAKACYDVREAPVFWAKMNIVSTMPEPVEWLSTHPSHETRMHELAEMLPGALKIRAANSCPLLPPPTLAQTNYNFSHFGVNLGRGL